jgi:tryptophan synthase alpha chain
VTTHHTGRHAAGTTGDRTSAGARAASKASAAIEKARDEGRAALIGYLPAGFPDVQTTIDAGIAMAENGVDLIEIGIPYSDPVMDGHVIQEATVEALANGFTVPRIFDVVEGITRSTDAAVLVMTYWNPVMRMGVREFAERLAAAGGAGLITPDLIPDEASEWLEVSEDLGLDRVFLVAPSTSPQRMQNTVDASRGFVYAVSVMGVTGARTSVGAAARAVVDSAHAAGAERVCVGLGVSTSEQVREIGAYADGVIVGTALVAALRDGGVDAVAELTRELSTGTAKAST